MADLTTQVIVETGLAPTYAAAASGGDTADISNERTFLHVKNTNAATRDVTVDSTQNCNQGFDHNLVVTVAATAGDVMIGPLPRARFGRASDGRAVITYSAVTGVTIAVVRV